MTVWGHERRFRDVRERVGSTPDSGKIGASQRTDVKGQNLPSVYLARCTSARQPAVSPGRHLCWAVLKGEIPADLPVMRAVKFEFIINRQTAKTLGIAIPPGVLAIADEVIE